MDQAERELLAFVSVMSQLMMVFVVPLLWMVKGPPHSIGVYLLFTTIVVGIPLWAKAVELVVLPSIAITEKLLEYLYNG